MTATRDHESLKGGLTLELNAQLHPWYVYIEPNHFCPLLVASTAGNYGVITEAPLYTNHVERPVTSRYRRIAVVEGDRNTAERLPRGMIGHVP